MQREGECSGLRNGVSWLVCGEKWSVGACVQRAMECLVVPREMECPGLCAERKGVFWLEKWTVWACVQSMVREKWSVLACVLRGVECLGCVQSFMCGSFAPRENNL